MKQKIPLNILSQIANIRKYICVQNRIVLIVIVGIRFLKNEHFLHKVRILSKSSFKWSTKRQKSRRASSEDKFLFIINSLHIPVKSAYMVT